MSGESGGSNSLTLLYRAERAVRGVRRASLIFTGKRKIEKD